METVKLNTQSNAITQPKKSRLKKFLKFLLFGTSSLILIVFILNWIWISSGSNQWELEFDKNGVQVYSLKTPGHGPKKMRGVMRYRGYTLSQLVAPYLDEDTEEICGEWVVGCLEFKILQRFDPKLMAQKQQWTFEYGWPFSNREMVLNGYISQDPETKMVLMENLAAPNTIPETDGVVRLTHFHNTFRFTPLPNGEIELDFRYDMDIGGFFPDILWNLAFPGLVYKSLHDEIPEDLDKAKYRNAKFDFIEELEIEGGVAIGK